MSDPQRFCEGGGGALEKQVVDSVRGEGPSPKVRRRVEVALGLAAGLPAATVATNALGASKAAQAGVAAGLAKWVGVVSITGLAAAGATVYVSARAGAGANSLSVPNGVVARTSASAPRAPTPAPRSPIPASPAPSPSTQEGAPPAPATTAVRATAPASVPAAAPTVPPAPVATVLPTKSAPTLSDELRVLDEARAAMETGDSERALALLDRHDREFASPALAPEAMALRVEVYARRGDREATARLASRFLERFGDRPEAQRVRSLVDAPPLEAKP
jgi:hypothetical protein